MTLSEEMIRYTEDHRQEAYGLLLELAKIPMPSNHEERRAEFCANWLKAQGVRGVYVDQTLNMVYPADVRQDRPVEVFMAYMDVMFPDEAELPLRVEGEHICCPGMGDNAACLVCLLLAGKYIVGYVDSPRWREIRGEDAPGFLLICDAEEEGLRNLKEMHGACEDYGDKMERFCTFDSSLSSIVDRAVGFKRFRVRVRTRGGHSYNNFGDDNIIACLASLMEELYGIRAPGGGRTTCNIGMISGGTSVNTIAQEAETLYKFRSDRKENLEYMERQFMRVIGQGESEGMDVSLEIIGIRPCEGPVDPKRKRALSGWAHRVMEGMTGQAPKHCAGSADCNIPLSLGIPGVCVGSFRDAGAHIREEYVETDSLEGGYEVAFGMIFGSRDWFQGQAVKLPRPDRVRPVIMIPANSQIQSGYSYGVLPEPAQVYASGSILISVYAVPWGCRGSRRSGTCP